MFDCFSNCSSTMKTGSVLGGMAGFAMGVWAAVKFVEPFFEEKGISQNMSTGITVVIALLGGIEVCIGAGIVAGALAAPVIKGGVYGVAHLASTFFGSNKNKDPVALSALPDDEVNENAPLLQV